MSSALGIVAPMLDYLAKEVDRRRDELESLGTVIEGRSEDGYDNPARWLGLEAEHAAFELLLWSSGEAEWSSAQAGEPPTQEHHELASPEDVALLVARMIDEAATSR
jgi:hypothetical protein